MARDAAGSAGEPQGAGNGEAPGAGRVSPGRATARACDREPGGPGEREGGGVEPEQAETFEVGRGVRAGAGENPVPAAGEEQCEAWARETGSGSSLAPDRAAPAGGDEPAAGGAASDPGGPGRVGRPGAGAGGLAAGRGARGVGAASEAAWQGARGTGETEQAGVVGALRASPAAAGTVGERLPRGAGALQAMAGAGLQSARDRRGDPGTNGSAGTLPGGVGGSATLGAGFVGKRAFRSGAGDREQGGRILPRGPERVGETGAGGGAVGRALTGFLPSS